MTDSVKVEPPRHDPIASTLGAADDRIVMSEWLPPRFAPSDAALPLASVYPDGLIDNLAAGPWRTPSSVC